MATDNLFKRAAAYRKKHKNLTQAEAVKAVAKMGKVGKTGPVKKKAVKRKVAAVAKVAGPKRKTGKRVGAARVVILGTKKRKSAIGSIAKTKKLLNEIESLERQRKQATKKELRDIIQLEINGRHDKIDGVRRQHRRQG